MLKGNGRNAEHTERSLDPRRGPRISLIAIQAALLLGISALPSWAGPFRKLPEVGEVAALAELQSEWESLPRTLHRVPVAEGEGREDVRIALEEIGAADSDRVIVMIHGALSDRRAWSFMAADLASDHSLLLVDMLGAGDSDRPNPKKLPPDGYGPSAQARRVLQALRIFLTDRPEPTRLTLVGHSLGGAVALRMTGDPALREQFDDVIDRVDRIVLFAPLDIAVEKTDPRFVKVTKLGKLKVGLGTMLGVLRKEVALTTIHGYVDPGIATKEDARRLLQILKRRKSRRPAQAMIRQAVPFDPKSKRPIWEKIEEMVADYRNVDIPCLIVWGSRDETLPASMGYKLRAQLPQAWLRVVSESKHSLPRERPRLAASIAREFTTSGGADWSRVEEIRPGQIGDSAARAVQFAACLGPGCPGESH
jgi:pimeloyl-ACP methyl ester carboxylesterase